jgi:hypothetical protein
MGHRLLFIDKALSLHVRMRLVECAYPGVTVVVDYIADTQRCLAALYQLIPTFDSVCFIVHGESSESGTTIMSSEFISQLRRILLISDLELPCVDMLLYGVCVRDMIIQTLIMKLHGWAHLYLPVHPTICIQPNTKQSWQVSCKCIQPTRDLTDIYLRWSLLQRYHILLI